MIFKKKKTPGHRLSISFESMLGGALQSSSDIVPVRSQAALDYYHGETL